MNQATLVHPVGEKLPAPRLAALGLQHVLVMDAGAIAVALNLFFNGTRGDTAGAIEAAKTAEAH